MSGSTPAPHKPDGRVFASYPMPAKIDLINERPRRESLVEKELDNMIASRAQQPTPQAANQSLSAVNHQTSAMTGQQNIKQQVQNQQDYFGQPHLHHHHHNQIQVTISRSNLIPNQRQPEHQIQQQQQHQSNQHQQHQSNQQQQQQHLSNQHQTQQTFNSSIQQPSFKPATSTNHNSNIVTNNTNTTTTTTTRSTYNDPAIFAAELAKKEAKLMADITALQQRPYSPFQVPDKIDLTSEQRIVQQQYQNAPSPRPISRASSTRSTTSADLLTKEAKLMQEIEEMEKKPYNPQRMVVEREQWFEYPQGRPADRHLTDSKRRVKDFCSLPSYMYSDQNRHIHEENLNSLHPGNVVTTIIRSPQREVDNKSPLPFAFDNFSTKGVRGNIASATAIEPDRPRPPIYPIIKRTPSPNPVRG